MPFDSDCKLTFRDPETLARFLSLLASDDDMPFDGASCDKDCGECEDPCFEEEDCVDPEEEYPWFYGVPEIERVIISGPATTIIWEDGTKTTVKCIEGQPQDRYAGFCAAVCKKMFGSTSAAKKLLDECDVMRIKEQAAQEEEERRLAEKAAELERSFTKHADDYESFKKEVDARAREMIVQRAAKRRMADLERVYDRDLSSHSPFRMGFSPEIETNED